MLGQRSSRQTYVMELSSSECWWFSDCSFINYDGYGDGILLEMMPKGGGGATMLDTEYILSYLYGNDVFSAFTVSVFNKKNKTT